MEFEYVEPEYDEVEDSYEIRASREEYERLSALLLKLIEDRDDFAKLLKIAKPAKIAGVREHIADFNDLIEEQEKVIELQYKVYQSRQKLWRSETKLVTMCDFIVPQLTQHLAENAPEKLELLEAILSDKGQSH